MKRLRTILQFKNIIVFTLVIIIISIFRIYNYNSKYDVNDNKFILKITDINYKNEGYTIIFKGKKLLIGKYYNDFSNFDLGDLVEVKGSISYPYSSTILNTFNYKNYLLSEDIHYVIKIDKIKLVKRNNNIFYKLKSYIKKYIDRYKYRDLLYAFILGNKSYIDEYSINNLKSNGIIHLLAISGMHISFLSYILFKLLSFFRVREIRKYYITFLVLVLFSFMTNFSSSVLRSSLFFLLLGINKIKRIKLNKINILLITLDIILILFPNKLLSISLILSFIVTLFILLFYKEDETYFKSLIRLSIVSFLSSFPIIINMNYEFNLLTIINNLLFIPLVSIIIYPFCIISLFLPFLSYITNIFINIFYYLNNLLSTFSLNIIYPKMPIYIIIIYYVLLIVIYFKKDNIYKLLLVLILLINYLLPYIDRSNYVIYFDVKQGDSEFIRYSNNKTILIDTGGIYNDEYIIKNILLFLKSKGIKKIDYLILSHGDYDHIGYSNYLIDNFKVNNVIFNCGSFNDLEHSLVKLLDKKKIPYYSCINKLNNDNNELYFLNTKEYDNENDNSNVIYTKINNYKFLFMADAGEVTEKEIISKYNLSDIDILKVGHHGSKTSSSEYFINEIKPKYSIISVGKNNRYGHPNKEVLNNLSKSKIYRTDIDGSIMFKIKKNKLKIEII